MGFSPSRKLFGSTFVPPCAAVPGRICGRCQQHRGLILCCLQQDDKKCWERINEFRPRYPDLTVNDFGCTTEGECFSFFMLIASLRTMVDFTSELEASFDPQTSFKSCFRHKMVGINFEAPDEVGL